MKGGGGEGHSPIQELYSNSQKEPGAQLAWDGRTSLRREWVQTKHTAETTTGNA